MKPLKRFIKRLGSWARTRQDEDRLRAEIEDHLARQTEDNMQAGLPAAEARRQALLKFGATEAIREQYRDQKGLPFMETLLRDVRYALRRLWKAPAFTLATILTLALGIGATTSIFTLVHAVLLKSLPVANPAELYRLGKQSRCCYTGGYSQDEEFSLVSYDLYKYLRDNTKGFSELAAFPAIQPLLGVRKAGSKEAAQSYPGEFVSGNYFAMFGVKAYAGRELTPQDDVPGAPTAAVMSFRLWQQQYGSDPSVVGSIFNVNDKPFTIVGITPPGFFGDTLRDSAPDFFLPLNAEPVVEVDADLDKYDTHWLELIGRIQPGANPAAIEAEMRVELKQWLRSHWNEMSANERARFPYQTLFLRPGGSGISSMREEYEHWLHILMAVSGFVLLIACANVANLMLVRGIEQRRQTSVTVALGASTGRLTRQALTESILLSLLGGAAGVAIAFAGTRAILHFAFPPTGDVVGSVPIDASPSVPVLLFAFGISLITGLVFGIAPAWIATRIDPIEALRGAGRSTTRTGSLPRRTLVVVQAALSLALLSASGLLTLTLRNLEHRNLGFQQDRRIVMEINPRLGGYQTRQLPELYQRIHDSISSVPGVADVALCLLSPQSWGGWGTGVWVDGNRPPGPLEDNSAFWDRVSGGYFDVIGTPIVRGRGISEEDTASSRKVAVINEAFAKRFFGNRDPIGKHVGMTPDASRELEVVGVARNARYSISNFDGPDERMLFLPETQADYSKSNIGSLFLKDIVIVTKPGAQVPFARVRAAMAAVDPDLPVIGIQTLSEQVSSQLKQQRLIARLTSLFGALSLVLASIGLYGVTAYNAGCRVNEIGVRMAMGASQSHVVALVLRGAFALVAFGLLCGLPLSFAAGRFLGHQLYGLNPYDPAVITIAVVTLGLSAFAASLIPAVRAGWISPLEALREE